MDGQLCNNIRQGRCYNTASMRLLARRELNDADNAESFFLIMNFSFFFLQYLLAMVYAYFRRAELGRREYNKMNFFIAL